MAPRSRPTDTRTGSRRTRRTTDIEDDGPPTSKSRFARFVTAAMLAALSVYLVFFPGVAMAIGSIIVAIALFSIGPLVVFWIGDAIRSALPVGSKSRSIDRGHADPIGDAEP